LPGLESKVVSAEDEIERVAILAAPLSMEAVLDLKELQLSAIRDTERAVKAAKLNFDAAQRELERVKHEADTLADPAKASINEELQKFEQRLEAVSTSLDEHKNVRKDHELSSQAEKLFGELSSRLAGVEVDCEKAAMMAEPLSKASEMAPQDINATDLRESKESLRIASAKLAPTMRLISTKATALKGHMRNKMLDLQSRAEASQALLDKAQQKVDDANSRAAALPILKQASERLAAVEEFVERMRETEAPFLMGIETLPDEESSEALGKMEKAAALAMSALADAKKYVGLKTVELGRLAEATAEAAKSELEKVKKQIDANVERVRKFQAETAKRRRTHCVFTMKEHVDAAEAAVQKLQALSGELHGTDPEKLLPALEKAQSQEIEAQDLLTVARREVQERQQDLRPLDDQKVNSLKSSSDVLRFKVRISQIESALTKFKSLAHKVSEQLQVHKSLIDISRELACTDAELARLSDVSKTWTAGEKPPPEDEEAAVRLQESITASITQVEQKIQSAHGLELQELRAVSGRLKTTQKTMAGIKALLKSHTRSASLSVVQEASAVVKKAEEKLAEIGGAASKPKEQPVDGLPELLRQAREAAELASQASTLVIGHGQQLTQEAKVEFARLSIRSKAADRKAKIMVSAVSSHYEAMMSESTAAVLEALRSSARRGEGGSYAPEKLFEELSEGLEAVSEKQLCGFFGNYGMPDGFTEEKVQFAISLLAPHGLTRRAFAATLAEFYRVARDIAITDKFEIKSAKRLRKLELEEILEAQGSSQVDETLGLERIMCRAVADGAEGWVTVKSRNIHYLQPAKKPYLCCAQDVRLRPQPKSEEAQQLFQGDVLELLQGPKEERLSSELRLRGVTCDDEASGWLQVRGRTGEILAEEKSNMYTCVEAIAMTDVSDFNSCTMVRRVGVGEALEMLQEEPVHPGGGGATRQKFRACLDSVEGWITTHGSQGKVYVKAAKKNFVCLQACPLHAGLGVESSVVKVLMPGEAFRAFEEPKEVSGGERLVSYNVRAVSDGSEGWVVATAAGEVTPWTPTYKVLKTTPLTKSLAANDAAEIVEVVRVLDPLELLDLTGPPVIDSTTGQLRARCVAKLDAAVGWATVREGQLLQLRPASAEELEVSKQATQASVQDEGSAAPTTPPLSSSKGRGKGSAKGHGKASMQVKQEEEEENSWSWRGAKRGYAGGGQYAKKFKSDRW